MIQEAYYPSPCLCAECKRGEHCYYCLHGNPGSHFVLVAGRPDDDMTDSHPHWRSRKTVLAWFRTCFPQYRVGEKIVIPEEAF